MEIILDYWVNSVNKEQSQESHHLGKTWYDNSRGQRVWDRFKESSKAAGLKDGKKNLIESENSGNN